MTEHKIYSTEAKNCVYQAAKQLEKNFSANDITEHLSYLGHKHSNSTIYRILEEMVKNGILAKNHDTAGITRYYFLENCDKTSHFYIICRDCKEAYHVDCELIDKLYQHFFDDHGFIIAQKNLQIDGLCRKCQKNRGIL